MQNLIENKKEYIDILLDNLTVPICNVIYDLYKSSSNIQDFQNNLSLIKNWNNNKIEEHYLKIINSQKKRNFIKSLLYEIIIINIKLKTENKNIDLNRIKIIAPTDFIHKCLINSAIYSWKNAYLFSHKNLKPIERQYHLNIVEKNIRQIIKDTIRDSTPFELIFDSDYISNEAIKQKYKNNDDLNKKNVKKHQDKEEDENEDDDEDNEDEDDEDNKDDEDEDEDDEDEDEDNDEDEDDDDDDDDDIEDNGEDNDDNDNDDDQ